MRRQDGFTLIELLVVIAIIGILAAIIFPVYAQAKKSAYKSSDLSNMNSLRTALQLYKTDNGAYPPALLGFIGPYENVSNGNILPANSIKDALYPKRVDSLNTFRPALNRIADNQAGVLYSTAFNANNALVTTAYWPKNANLYQGSTDAADLQRQRFGSGDLTHRAVQINGVCQVVPNVYYRISGYDVAPASNAANANMESHYQLFWSANTVSSDLGGKGTDPVSCDSNAMSAASGSATDTPRQLGYSEPPETTVVTWNPFFRDYLNGSPQHQKQDLVLFLEGSARPEDSANVAAQAWTVLP